MLATDTWTGAGGNTNWSNGANWSSGNAPNATGDTLVFPASATAYASNNDEVTSVVKISFSGGGYNLTGNALTVSGGIVDTGNNVIALGQGTTGISLSAAQTFTVNSGTLVLDDPLALGSVTKALTVTGAGNLTISGVVSGSTAAGQDAIVKGTVTGDSGILTLTSADTYAGITAVRDGILNIQNAAALGVTDNLQILNNTTGSAVSSATVQIQGGITVPATISSIIAGGTVESVAGSNTLSGAITLTRNATANQAANFKVDSGSLTLGSTASIVADSATSTGTYSLVFTKSGAGQLDFDETGVAGINTFSGGANITAGIVSINDATAADAQAALGPSTSTITVGSGATLQINPGAASTFSNPLILNGAGSSGIGALYNEGKTNVFSGNITLNSAATINTLNAATISGALSSNGSSTNNLTKLGPQVLTLTNANAGFTANLMIGNNEDNVGNLTPGTVAIATATGSLSNAAGYTVEQGGAFTVGDNASNNSTRLSSTSTITLNGGNLNLAADATGTTSETFAAVVLNTGSSTITSNDDGGTATWTITNLTRNAGATGNFLGSATAALGTANNQILVTNVNGVATSTGNELVHSILPWGIVGTSSATDADFATYSTASPGGIEALAAGSYVTSLTGATASSNVKLTTAGGTITPLTGNLTVNSLIIVTGSTTAETINLQTHALTIGDSSVSGSTGGLLITGNASEAVTISAGTGGALTFANEGIVYVGTTAKTTATTISAPITGTGVALTVDPFGAAASQLTLSDTTGNSYSGATTLAGAGAAGAGVLSVAKGADLGTGTLVLDNGTLTATAAATISNPVTINGTPTLGSTFGIAFSGAVTIGGNSTITQSDTGGVTFGAVSDNSSGDSLSIAGASASTFSGAISGALALNTEGTAATSISGSIGGTVSLNIADTGAGTVTVTSASNSNTYTGGTTITSGTLLVNGNISSITTVNSGGTLEGTGTVGAVVVNSGGFVSPGGGSGVYGALTASSVNLSSGGNLSIAAQGSTAGGYDTLTVTGSLTLGGTSLLSLNLSGYSSPATFTPITAAGGLTGTFSDTFPTSPTPATLANVASSAEITNNPIFYGVTANYASTASLPLTIANPVAPTTLVLSDNGGTYHGTTTYPATTLVNGSSNSEGIAPTLSYYPGSTATGTPLSGAPNSAGTYTVVANFPGSPGYTSATSNNVTFTIAQATPTVAVSDAGGIYNGSTYPATATIEGVGATVGSFTLETISPTLSYYSGSTATGTPLSGIRAWLVPIPSWPTFPAARITPPPAAAQRPSPSRRPRQWSPSAMPAGHTPIPRSRPPRSSRESSAVSITLPPAAWKRSARR